MKKLLGLILIFTMLCLAGCNKSYGKQVFMCHKDNQIGLRTVYYGDNKVTFDFGGHYKMEDNGIFYDIFDYLEKRSSEDKDQLFFYVKSGSYRMYTEDKIGYDANTKMVSLDTEIADAKDIEGLMISFRGRQFYLDMSDGSIFQSKINPVKIHRRGAHLYYPEDLFDRSKTGVDTSADKGDIQRCLDDFLDKIGSSLTEDTYFYQYHYQRNARDSDVTVNGNVFINGAAVDITDTVAYTSGYSIDYDPICQSETMPDINTEGLIDPMELIPDVLEFARQNMSKEDMGYPELIYGDSLLRYDRINDLLYYRFTLNRYFYVKVDPRTGEITGSDFSGTGE